jgi:hypothetical protein
MIIVGGWTRSGARSYRPTPRITPSASRAWPAVPGISGPFPCWHAETAPWPLVTARYQDLRVVLTRDHERP